MIEIIKSYDSLPLGKYIDIQAIAREDNADEVDKQARILSVLTDTPPAELLHLPIAKYHELVEASAFLLPEKINYRPVAKKYIAGDFELYPVLDFRRLETAQYIDFQTYAPDMDNKLIELLSVVLVPKGCRYNEGYNIAEVQQAIREYMSVTDGVSVIAFFLTWFKKSIAAFLNSSKQEAAKVKDPMKRAALMKKIQQQKTHLQNGGGGSQM